MKSFRLLPWCFFCLLSAAYGAEIFVDQSAPDGGDGSIDKPFKTIAAGVKAAAGGDVVTVKKGTYAETVVLSKSGTAEQPSVLRAAAGERVVLSGFVAITGWKEDGAGVFSTTIDGPLTELFVGLNPQPVSRWPELSEPMRHLVEPDTAALTFKDSAPLADEPAIKDLIDAPKSAMAFIYVRYGNYYTSIPITKIDAATNTVTVEKANYYNNIKGKDDRYQFVNHPALITRPGHWAFVTEGKSTRIYFRPAKPDDLEHTQYRPGKSPMITINGKSRTEPVSYVRVEGFEVRGSGSDGIAVRNTEHAVVTHCLSDFNSGYGITTRWNKDLQVTNNLVVANGYGMVISSVSGALVQENEVAANMVDGLLIVGNSSGKPGGEPETDDVTVRHNYLHHHILLAHPDNLQTYSGVTNLKLDSNVLTWGGQGMMTENTQKAEIRNTVVVGTAAVAVIFGHGKSIDWTIENSTVGLGGWGAFSFTGTGYHLKNNVIWDNTLNAGSDMESSDNLFYLFDPKLPMFYSAKPEMKTFNTPADVTAATKLEAGSVRTDQSPFKSAPAFQAVAPWDDKNTPSLLVLRNNPETSAPPSAFTKGDKIEVNGDHVLREVTKVNADSIEFAPPLPARPFRESMIWNWKNAESAALDLRPIKPSTPPIGSDLDIPAFERGDFNGDGKRDIPEVPEDLKAAWPNPNNVVLPLKGA